MKSIIKLIKNNRILHFLVVVGFFSACTPDMDDQELGPKPEASFTVTPVEGRFNTYLLTSEINAATFQWDKGDGFEPGAKVDTAYFPMAGQYTVKMNAFTQGGMVTTENIVTVDENDPSAACVGNAVALLTGCGESQTWVLAGGGSLAVGPTDGSTVWWEIPDGEVEMRNCVLNDQFTFYEDGTFAFDNLGDVWVEGNSLLGLESGDACADWSSIGPDYAAWGPGSDYTYEASSSEITLSGEGAFLGLYKVANVGEIQTPDEAGGSVTYTVLELTAESLVVEINFGGGIWTYTFIPEGTEVEEPGEPAGNWYDGLTEGDDVITGGAIPTEENWTVFVPGADPTAKITFDENGAVIGNLTESGANGGIWQSFEVKADQQYKFSANVKGGGAVNSWFEVYFGTTEPINGTDYSEGLYTGLNTWDGCGADAYDGDLAILACKNDAIGTDAKGLVTFEEAGTVYILIKGGNLDDGTLGADGVLISDIKLVEMN